ncbi:cytochrome c maturation protein CcmE [Polyangium jinanense]|uniref:Cytochrome c maturation protein CcmE n=1 Tax=Polyangium jinanense TaxID=2829994 RepID=A0A9X3X1G1_9BACT|nr:cytochrome c maturation protein CcmE [Polyangium jinanense]MDC3952915.1 cytochrome c maturation protein CcmE [Polyangium jinanense]MDC3980533.1 cytochrome c maturation protein CcmE [Polyangium jinanense]
MSKKLDEELAQAAGIGRDDDGPAAMPPLTVPQPAEKARPKNSSMGLLITLLVMGGGLVSLFMFGFKEAAIYATPVDQLLAQQDKLMGRKVRVEGELVPGTLEKRDKPCEYRFTIHGKDGKQTLPVRYPQCVIPDTFRDVPAGGVQVTVEGSLKSATDFEATLVMAKCTSKYDPKTHEMKQGEGQGMPIN